MQQELALPAFVYGLDSHPFIKEDPETFYITLPKEGVAAWTDWYIKVRGTHHGDLVDHRQRPARAGDAEPLHRQNTYMFGSLEADHPGALDGLPVLQSGSLPRPAPSRAGAIVAELRRAQRALEQRGAQVVDLKEQRGEAEIGQRGASLAFDIVSKWFRNVIRF